MIHQRYGRIEYKSKAEVMVPGVNPVESLEEEFFVISRSPPEIEANYKGMLSSCR